MASPAEPPSETAAHDLPLLNARRWALGFLAFAIVLAVVFAEFLVGFVAHAH
ncbi:hypothetical protein [Amycolatopsis dendrobii]|uniref:Uncharacterized protein n=1 Tax=Amycolatopsis dendrobii TaxID=2760662 RepID=A0A7W3ZEJ8_9PSEU|nr:hypothetical protein [Amycolatopsis dendrobii]MBB1158113.1 hypothetical protein [Amycolatopsis dendrobii]